MDAVIVVGGFLIGSTVGMIAALPFVRIALYLKNGPPPSSQCNHVQEQEEEEEEEEQHVEMTERELQYAAERKAWLLKRQQRMGAVEEDYKERERYLEQYQNVEKKMIETDK